LESEEKKKAKNKNNNTKNKTLCEICQNLKIFVDLFPAKFIVHILISRKTHEGEETVLYKWIFFVAKKKIINKN